MRAIGQALRWIPSIQEDGGGCDPNCTAAGRLDCHHNINFFILLLFLAAELGGTG
jgi:hypothetical protein